ncbi:hypothetical protein D3C73_1603780 [compost metagenome]
MLDGGSRRSANRSVTAPDAECNGAWPGCHCIDLSSYVFTFGNFAYISLWEYNLQ